MGVVLVSAFTEVKRCFTEVKSRLTVVKPRFTECAVRFIEVLDPSGNRDSITSRGAKRPCRHGARAQKTTLLENSSEMCCYSLSFLKLVHQKKRFFAKKVENPWQWRSTETSGAPACISAAQGSSRDARNCGAERLREMGH